MDQLKAFAASGRLRPGEMILQEGALKWVQASAVLAGHGGDTPGPPPSPPTSAPPRRADLDSGLSQQPLRGWLLSSIRNQLLVAGGLVLAVVLALALFSQGLRVGSPQSGVSEGEARPGAAAPLAKAGKGAEQGPAELKVASPEVNTWKAAAQWLAEIKAVLKKAADDWAAEVKAAEGAKAAEQKAAEAAKAAEQKAAQEAQLAAAELKAAEELANKQAATADQKKKPDLKGESVDKSKGAASEAVRLPFTLDQVERVLGRANEKSNTHLLYRGKVYDRMKVTRVGESIHVAFGLDNEALFYAAGLFTSQLFTKSESDQIIAMIDDMGKERVIGRFNVRVQSINVPIGWRQVSLSPR